MYVRLLMSVKLRIGYSGQLTSLPAGNTLLPTITLPQPPCLFSLSASLVSHKHAHRFANGSCWLCRCISRRYKDCLPPPPERCHWVEPRDGNSPTFLPPVFIVFLAAAPPHHPPPLHVPPFYFHVEPPPPAARSFAESPARTAHSSRAQRTHTQTHKHTHNPQCTK